MMKNQQFTGNWNDPSVKGYEQKIKLKIAAYDDLFDMTQRILRATLQKDNVSPNLLIVGAGGGQELVTFGEKNRDWCYTAVDSSAPMLEIAKNRCVQTSYFNRIQFENRSIETFHTHTPFDGATCLLVLHFIKGIDKKRHFIRHITRMLKPGAPFLVATLKKEADETAFGIQLQAWKSHMQEAGISTAEFNQFVHSIGDTSDPITSKELISLLYECELTCVSQYFCSYLIEAYMAVKK